MSTPACSHTEGNAIAHVQGCAYGRGSRVPRGPSESYDKEASASRASNFPWQPHPTKTESAAAIGRSSSAATAEFHNRRRHHNEFTHAHACLSARRSHLTPGD
jgi:hypothetical protein